MVTWLSLLDAVSDGGNHLAGFLGPGNFYDEKWQKALMDPCQDNNDIRKGVLGRMRLPYNTQYTQARAGQAYPYFMPWLSGDESMFPYIEFGLLPSTTN